MVAVLFAVVMMFVAGVSYMEVVRQFKLLRASRAPRGRAAIIATAMVFIAVAVRLHRAADAALWELCPEILYWMRETMRAAHGAVVAAQWGGHPPAGRRPTPPAKVS